MNWSKTLVFVVILTIFTLCVCEHEKCLTKSKLNGKCVRLTECPRFKKPIYTSEDFEWIHMNICPDSSKLICCEENTLLATEDECEVANVDRLINGNKTAIDQYPFFALLAYEDSKENKIEFNCGGSLINHRYVITAAHCITDELKFVRLGEWDLESKLDCVSVANQELCADEVVDIGIELKIKHRRYVKGKNDIALIKLERDVMYTDYIQPVCLPKEKSSILENQKIVAIGFGVTEFKQKSRYKLFVLLPYITPEDCQRNTHRSFRSRINFNTTICTQAQGRENTCIGDSGGPIVDAAAEYYILRGLTATGLGGCTNKTVEYPSYFTDVYEYLDWINLHLYP